MLALILHQCFCVVCVCVCACVCAFVYALFVSAQMNLSTSPYQAQTKLRGECAC